MANIVGDYPEVERVVTGLWSLDRALSNKHSIGFPMTTYEITGFGGIGKSTWSASLLGIVGAYYKKNLVYAPIEPIDRELLSDILDSMNFTNDCHLVSGQTDEEIVDIFCEKLGDDTFAGGVFDSLTAISPIAEVESSSADMNMGRRARLSGVLARKLVHLNRFRQSPVATILISHVATSMSMTPTNTGSTTTGGETKKNLSKVRIKLRKLPEPTMTELEDNAYVIEGMVEKFNFGKDKRKFYCVVVGGQGIHVGLSAVYDCKMLKIASFGKSVTMNGEKYGNIRSLVAKAHAGDNEVFQPFIEALKNPSKVEKVAQESEEAEPSDVFLDELPE